MEISDSSHRPAWLPVPAEVKMSAGEIVKLLPSLSPGLSQALLRFLQERCTAEGVVKLRVNGFKIKAVLEQVCEGFAAELEAAGAAVEEGSSSDVILQLSFCLLLALAPSLPDAREILIRGGVGRGQSSYGGEQAVEVLYSALVSQHWSNGVRRLTLWHRFGTGRACEHLAHLLQSGHCKLQQLTMKWTGTGAGGMRHIARALETNSSLTVLQIDRCSEVGDGGVEQLAAMLRTNSTLEMLTLYAIGMTAHGLRHLCDALSTQQSLPATSSSPRGTIPTGHIGGLKKLNISGNDEIGEGGAALLGAMLAQNRCLRSLDARCCDLREEDGEGHLAKGLRENSTLEELYISGNKLGKVALGLLVRYLSTNTSLKKLEIGDKGEMPAAEELAHMVTHNHSIVELGLGGAAYDAREWATVILPALGRNKTLLSIDLESCCGVRGQQVRAALFDLLRNTTIQEIDLRGTPLHNSGKSEAVEAELRRNNVLRHALSALPKDVPHRLEPNHERPRAEETCYPNANRKQDRKRGLALIVSMESNRPGAAVDRGRLEILATVCGFREVVLMDGEGTVLAAADLPGIINSVVEEQVLEEDECFLCSINGHGGTQGGQPYILDRDGAKIMVMRDIVEPFRRSKHLQGKPKVIFINCCRGRMLYVKSQTVDFNCQSVEADADAQQGTGSSRPHVTNLSDCLLMFSTSEDSPSCRDPQSGSIFVKHLVETVVDNRQKMDVLHMMTMVNERVNEEQNLTVVDPDTKTKVIVGQCCEYRASLRKYLYWNDP